MEVTAGVASRPVTPERISSMRSSPTSMRLGLEGLVEPRGVEVELRGGEVLMSCVPGWEWVRGAGGRKVERMWCRLWSVAERGEF